MKTEKEPLNTSFKNDSKNRAEKVDLSEKPYLAQFPEEISKKIEAAMVSLQFGLVSAQFSELGTLALKIGYNKNVLLSEDFSYHSASELLMREENLQFDCPAVAEAFSRFDKQAYKEGKADLFLLTNPENGQKITVLNNGLFFEDGKSVKYLSFDSVTNVEERSLGLLISAKEIYDFGYEPSMLAENAVLRIPSPVCHGTVRTLRHFLESVMNVFGNPQKRDVREAISEILASSLKSISKSSPVYSEEDFWSEKGERVLNNALHKYALKVRRDEALALIDTSLLGNGKDGILFSVDGIAFDHAFEKVFLKYEEIREMVYSENGKQLIFSGNFSECKNPEFFPKIDSLLYNLDELKSCVERIQYLI